MAKYDGLIIPRSYNDYINKSDPAGVAQALQLTGVMDNAPTAQSNKPAKSGGIFASNAVIMASNKTLSGVAISAGSVVRVLFTAALTGSDATTGLTLTYNGNTYAVKVEKNGALANFLANNIDGSYIYCQAYTTLELMFDGSQFIIMGNPVVISSADYTIYTDGLIIDNRYGFTEYELFETVPNDAVVHKYVSLAKDHIYLLEAYSYDDVNEIRINVTVDERVFVVEKTSYAGTTMGGQLIFYCDANQECEFRYSFNHAGGSRKIRYSITDLGKIK